MLGITKRTILAMLACVAFCGRPAFAQDVPSDYQDVLKFLDRKGDFKDGPSGRPQISRPESSLQGGRAAGQ